MATKLDEKGITALVKANPVVIFSKTWCPYCRRAKAALKSAGIKVTAVELDERSDGSAIQATLGNMTGHRTVPSVWLGGKFFGGSDDTIAALKRVLSR